MLIVIKGETITMGKSIELGFSQDFESPASEIVTSLIYSNKSLDRHLALPICEVSGLRNAILQRVIWRVIMSGVFSGSWPIWHGETGRILTHPVPDEGNYPTGVSS